jgi:hypothetical protein
MSEFWRASSHPNIVSIRQQLSPSIMESYVEASKVFDAINYLGCCSNVCLFFQFGSCRQPAFPDGAVLETCIACRQQFTAHAEENPFTLDDISALTVHYGG